MMPRSRLEETVRQVLREGQADHERGVEAGPWPAGCARQLEGKCLQGAAGTVQLSPRSGLQADGRTHSDDGPRIHRDVLALAALKAAGSSFRTVAKDGLDHGMRPEEMEGLESWLAPPQIQLTTR